MAITVRKLDPAATFALVSAHNLSCANSIVVGGSLFHADKTSTTTTDGLFVATATVLAVSAANATDLTSCIALVNNMRGVLVVHMADGISTDPYSAGAHKIPDTVDTATLGALVVTTGNTATDTAAVVAAINAHKASFNTHLSQASPSAVHFNNDGTNSIGTADATDLASSITLLNASKTKVNAHINSGPSTMIKLVGP